MVDSAWKKSTKNNSWYATIAWKNINPGSIEEQATRIFANSAQQTEAYAILRAIKDMEWRCSDLIIEMDNKEVVQALFKNVTIY